MNKKSIFMLLASCFVLASCSNKGGALEVCMNDNNYEILINDYSSSPEVNDPTIDDCNGTRQTRAYERDGYNVVFKDVNFKNGFRLSKPDYGPGESPYYDQKIVTYDNNNKPSWGITQWNTAHDFYSNKKFIHERTTYGLEHTFTSFYSENSSGYEMPGKIVKVNSYTGSIYLEDNCEVEYEKPRTGSEPWVHLLVEQDFGVSNECKISSLSDFTIDISYKVIKCDKKMGDEYNPMKHAGQFVFYLTLQNRTYLHPDFGKYVWFGLHLYDDRNDGLYSSKYTQHDAGTGSLIYIPDSKKYQIETDGKIPHIGQEARACLNAMEDFEDALKIATELGYFTSTKLEDLYVCGFNCGFEIPGTFNMAVQIENIGFFSKYKN